MKHSSNYDKYPFIRVSDRTDDCTIGWDAVCNALKCRIAATGRRSNTVVIECYQGVMEDEIAEAIRTRFAGATLVRSADAMKSATEIDDFFREDITGDELFGYMTR
ncbi:MAG: mannose-6-phosphate isomerase, partial [Tannerella sp.]|nr:mannose-6-phosphate isomerase [Tannerella sp.]